ncbi:Tetratricopeptide repeat-domain-containing protein [Corynascus novoguineensis]|uniref:Tetratricopeptide repeat-domain-containing protein n=1 Tax=Corynascus novoguineensis TaxID=1126955 RepID=A0AAN7CV58_9PEZI|nr:Tetratricopeptide repeat-domain-containing protein [Corynascus novoguineensis]
MAGYMEVLRGQPELAAVYPGATRDKLFEATYRHVRDGMSCEECACNGRLVPRARLDQGDGQPVVHFGLIASGDTVMKSAKHRDDIAREADVIGFEMESAGVWDALPCVVIKDQGLAAIRGGDGGGMYEGFLELLDVFDTSTRPYPGAVYWPLTYTIIVLVPYPRNDSFVGRASVLYKLKQLPLKSASQAKVALYGLGGIGLEAYPDMSVFWVHANNAERFRQAYTSIVQECRIPGYDDPKLDILTLVKKWLERKDCCQWLIVIDNADDIQLFFGQQGGSEINDLPNDKGNLERYLPECRHGAILVTTRNKQVGVKLTKGKHLIEVGKMDEGETDQLLRTYLDGISFASNESSTLSSRLEQLPLALVQAAAFIQENSIDVSKYLELLDSSDQYLVDLLSEEFETDGRNSDTSRAVAKTWILSFEQIQRQNAFASELLSFMSLLDRQAIPLEFLSYYSKQQQGQETRGEMQLTKALGVLKAFSFVVEEKDHRFDIHRLVQLAMRRWLVKKGKIRHFAGQALLAVSHCYPFGWYENWGVCSAYLAHAYAVLGSEGTSSRDEKAGKATLLHSVAGFFAHQGQWTDAERVQLEALKLREEVLGSSHPSTLTSMANLASTYWKQGRWEEAEKLDVQVMETRKTKLGADHPDTLNSMANLASTYRNQGRWEEAEKLFLQVLETSKTKLGADHPDTLTSMNNLAFVWKVMGRHRDAVSMIQTCYDLQQRVLGVGHPYTVSTLSTLESWLKENEGPVV